ncbi:MAG: hypothetical protein M0C28_42100 [Candidatus Moduliflexus flocculans]|nr:hypothetical protein [Candidatus Moduliflexus flocculans]
MGKLQNGFEYEAQLLVLNKNGAIAVKNDDALRQEPMGHCRARPPVWPSTDATA